MLTPVAQVFSSSNIREGLVMYDTSDRQTKFMRLIDIRKTSIPVAGITINGSHIVFKKPYKNLGAIGELEKESSTIVMKMVYTNKIEFLLVNYMNKETTISKEELIERLKKGENICGCAYYEKKGLVLAGDIDTKVMV